MTQFLRVICLAAAIAAAGDMAWAQGTGSSSSSLANALSDIERKIIGEYYRLKGSITGAEPQGQAPAAAPKKPTQTMRGLPKDAGKKVAEDHGDGNGKSKGKGKPGELPPGLAKKDQLPPGLAKRDKLPPGLQREQLPQDLQAKLPPAKPGTERVLVGADLVLLDKATNTVLDIMKNAALKAP